MNTRPPPVTTVPPLIRHAHRDRQLLLEPERSEFVRRAKRAPPEHLLRSQIDGGDFAIGRLLARREDRRQERRRVRGIGCTALQAATESEARLLGDLGARMQSARDYRSAARSTIMT